MTFALLQDDMTKLALEWKGEKMYVADTKYIESNSEKYDTIEGTYFEGFEKKSFRFSYWPKTNRITYTRIQEFLGSNSFYNVICLIFFLSSREALFHSSAS